jgi:hypothetical protein
LNLDEGGKMFGRIAKIVAYAKAPRKTFVLLHPVRALKFGAAYYAGKMLLEHGRRRREHHAAVRP